jgi:short-subunit dehydrogenase
MDLDNKRLVLNGASSGIGWALLRQLSRLPVQIVAVGREETPLRDAFDAAGATQARILPFPCDLARQEEVDRLFAYAVEQMGGIDVFFAEVYRLERGKRGQLVLVYPLAVRSGFFRAASGGHVPWLSQSPEAAARAVLRGIKKDRETIYTSWIMPPMLLVHHLLPFTRRWYQTLGLAPSWMQ